MQEVSVTARNGVVTKMDDIYVRGEMIRFIILPNSLKNSPMLKNMGRDREGTVRIPCSCCLTILPAHSIIDNSLKFSKTIEFYTPV